MKHASRVFLIVSLVVVLALNVIRENIAAQQPTPELILGFEGQASLGEAVAVSAYLVDPAGNPIQGETVTFSIDAEFMNTLGRVEIGRATTDSTGLVLIMYQPTLTDQRTIAAKFGGNEIFEAAMATSGYSDISRPWVI